MNSSVHSIGQIMLVMSYILVVSNRYSNSCAVLYVLSIQYLLTGGFQDLVIGSGYHPVVLSAWAFLVGAWQCACRHPVYYFNAYVAMSLIIQSRRAMFSRRWTGRPRVCVWRPGEDRGLWRRRSVLCFRIHAV